MIADAYAVLGLPPNAETALVKSAYRRLVKALHPDRAGGDPKAAERFQHITLAYQQILAAGERASSGRARASERTRVRVKAPRRGANREVRLRLTLEQAVAGGTRAITLAPGANIRAEVPAGVGPGDVLRLRGMGDPGRDGGPNGDALVTVALLPHPVFAIEGRDAHATLEITRRRLGEGGEETLDTPQGRVRLMLPGRAQDGQVLRIRGKGLPGGPGKPPGDLYVRLAISGGLRRAGWRRRA